MGARSARPLAVPVAEVCGVSLMAARDEKGLGSGRNCPA